MAEEKYYVDPKVIRYIGSKVRGMVSSKASEILDIIANKYLTLKIGTGINAGDDLNDYTTPGKYQIGTNSSAATLLNCPTKWAFSMVVYSTNAESNIAQEITEYTYADWMADTRPAIKYIRFRVENAWSKWFAIGGVDSIVAEGKTNDWNWIKYENGTAILWTQKTYTTTANDWTANGNVYGYNPPYLPNYPFDISDGAYSGMGTHLLEYSMFSAQSYGFRPALVSATKYAGTISTFLMIIAKWK